MSKIYLVVTVDIAPGARDQYLHKLTSHVEIMKNEPGCELVEVLIDDQSPDQILLWEVWSNRPSWDAHMVNANSAAWQKNIGNLVRGERIQILHQA